MSSKYLDVYKVVKCAEYKKALDENSSKLKSSIIESCADKQLRADAFIFHEDADNKLTLKLPVYNLELTFDERLVVIEDAHLLKFTALDATDEIKKEILSFFLDKNGLVYIGEYKPNPSYEYNEVSLFMDILEATLKALKAENLISY